MNMIRDEHCHMPSDGQGLRASVASPPVDVKSAMKIIVIVLSDSHCHYTPTLQVQRVFTPKAACLGTLQTDVG